MDDAVTFENNKIKYFARDEVLVHNSMENGIWFIVKEHVLDLTSLFKHHSATSMPTSMQELLAFAGRDISRFFSGKSGCLTPITTMTASGSVPSLAAATDEVSKMGCEGTLIPWYNDTKYVLGHITSDDRHIRIINTLLASTIHMTICEENSVNDISEQYSRFNDNAKNYLWKKWSSEGNRTIPLNMSKTLTENKIFKEEVEDCYPPSIWLYYIDDEIPYLETHSA